MDRMLREESVGRGIPSFSRGKVLQPPWGTDAQVIQTESKGFTEPKPPQERKKKTLAGFPERAKDCGGKERLGECPKGGKKRVENIDGCRNRLEGERGKTNTGEAKCRVT
jgi:hypothetical protein